MSEGIAYQNKDILFKYLSDLYQNSTLDVLGVKNLPRIKRLLPNEFPEVTANEKRSDTVFQLEDDSVLMLEYESDNNYVENHLKYIRYVHRISQRYFQKEKQVRRIRIVVVYTSEVTSTKNELSIGDLKINSNPVLLYQFNGDETLENIKNKIRNEQQLTQDDLFKLSILPLMKSERNRDDVIHDSIETAKEIEDDNQQVQAIAGILTSTDKFIDEEYAKQVKEWLRMTKVGRAFEEEKKEAVERAVEKAQQNAQQKERIKIAKDLLDVLSPELIAKKTGLEVEEIKKLKHENK
ncbi:transcriptional regulator [Oceanobacillus locisalsi]|uniref:Transcriptional regulator n=1 Tax=Oceanobacillus locisalsi TaxID=546107 RepID=A0ABW3NFN0_9BACI